ncbi:MAG: twin-arginine translocase subunit TatC [Acidimicrobiales bacterium]|nr:twin-arginine translocase subunit TatC [Acidimicrobiales bacterium]
MALTNDGVGTQQGNGAGTGDLNGAGARLQEDRDTGTMTLFEHLAELRTRLIVSILAIGAGAIVVWFLYGPIVHFMLRPYHSYVVHHPAKDITKGQLVATGPLEGFTTRLKVSVYGGIALACPVVFWELWRFMAPGLYKNEKRYIAPFVAAAVGLFAGGVTTAILVFPKAIDWLISVSGPGVVPLFSPSRYFTLYISMCLVFGAVFMYPLVLVFLQLVGVVPSSTWRRWRRPAIVVLCGVAAVITPSSDPFSFLAMAVPMVFLYEMSVLVGRLLKK